MTHIAYLGTGLLGSAFAEAALGRGDTVAVWNRTAAKAEALAPFGARVAASPAEAVRGAERVHVVLMDDASVNEVIAQCRDGLGADAIIVDHTTTQPALTAARCEHLASEGVRYLHCPVFIGPSMARKAMGTIMASGPRALFDAVHPALAAQAQRVEYLGERGDLAAVYKLCGNALLIGIAGTVADMFTVGKAAGVPATDSARLFDFFNLTTVVTGRGTAMAGGKFAPASFELAMARKDVRLMIETAGPLALAALPAVAERMDALIAGGHGADDLAVLARDAIG